MWGKVGGTVLFGVKSFPETAIRGSSSVGMFSVSIAFSLSH